MLSRLFNLGGDVDRSAEPEDQFFATLRRPMLALAIGCFALFFLRNAQRGIWVGAEADTTQIAAEFIQSPNFFAPTLNSEPQPGHPVVHAITVRWAWMLSGSPETGLAAESAWPTRLPSALSACAIVFGVFWIGLRLFNRRAAFIAAAVCGLTPGMFWAGRSATPEALFVACVVLAIGCCVQYRAEPKRPEWIILFHAFCALSALAGSLGGVILGYTVALILWSPLGREFPSRPFRIHGVIGFGAMCATLVIWTEPGWNAWLSNGDIEPLLAFAGRHGRSAISDSSILPTLVADTALLWLPWVALTPFALIKTFSGPVPMDSSIRRPMAAWIIMGVALSAFAPGALRPSMIVAWPAVALSIGWWLDSLTRQTEPRDGYVPASVASILLLVTVGLLAIVAGVIAGGEIAAPDFLDRWMTLGWGEGWKHSLRRWSAQLTALPCAFGAAAIVAALPKRNASVLFWGLSFSAVFAAIVWALLLLPELDPLFSPQRFSESMNQRSDPGQKVALFGNNSGDWTAYGHYDAIASDTEDHLQEFIEEHRPALMIVRDVEGLSKLKSALPDRQFRWIAGVRIAGREAVGLEAIRDPEN